MLNEGKLGNQNFIKVMKNLPIVGLVLNLQQTNLSPLQTGQTVTVPFS